MESLMILPVLGSWLQLTLIRSTKCSWSTKPSDLKNYTKVDCAFHYRAEQDSKVFSQLAWIVFVVPMTQVLVERLFSSVKFIWSDLPNSLVGDTCKQLYCNALMCEHINAVFVFSSHQLSSLLFITCFLLSCSCTV